MKIVVNRCYGGFKLSEEAYNFLGLKWDGYGFLSVCEDDENYMERNDPRLVKCVETLAERANGGFGTKLEVVEIPDDVKWYISDYDGFETIEEVHRSW